MIRYAITEGLHPPGDAGSDAAILRSAQHWLGEGVDFVQLREKHLPGGDLLRIAEVMLRLFRTVDPALSGPALPTPRPRLLINGRADIALAARADGVHLTSHPDELTPAQLRTLFDHANLPSPTVSLSCHTSSDVQRATDAGVDFILFGPVFEKRVGTQLIHPGVGLEALQTACRLAAPTPVLALGGITAANAPSCLAVGAAGIAGIRLFQPSSLQTSTAAV